MIVDEKFKDLINKIIKESMNRCQTPQVHVNSALCQRCLQNVGKINGRVACCLLIEKEP